MSEKLLLFSTPTKSSKRNPLKKSNDDFNLLLDVSNITSCENLSNDDDDDDDDLDNLDDDDDEGDDDEDDDIDIEEDIGSSSSLTTYSSEINYFRFKRSREIIKNAEVLETILLFFPFEGLLGRISLVSKSWKEKCFNVSFLKKYEFPVYKEIDWVYYIKDNGYYYDEEQNKSGGKSNVGVGNNKMSYLGKGGLRKGGGRRRRKRKRKKKSGASIRTIFCRILKNLKIGFLGEIEWKNLMFYYPPKNFKPDLLKFPNSLTSYDILFFNKTKYYRLREKRQRRLMMENELMKKKKGKNSRDGEIERSLGSYEYFLKMKKIDNEEYLKCISCIQIYMNDEFLFVKTEDNEDNVMIVESKEKGKKKLSKKRKKRKGKEKKVKTIPIRRLSCLLHENDEETETYKKIGRLNMVYKSELGDSEFFQKFVSTIGLEPSIDTNVVIHFLKNVYISTNRNEKRDYVPKFPPTRLSPSSDLPVTAKSKLSVYTSVSSTSRTNYGFMNTNRKVKFPRWFLEAQEELFNRKMSLYILRYENTGSCIAKIRYMLLTGLDKENFHLNELIIRSIDSKNAKLLEYLLQIRENMTYNERSKYCDENVRNQTHVKSIEDGKTENKNEDYGEDSISSYGREDNEKAEVSTKNRKYKSHYIRPTKIAFELEDDSLEQTSIVMELNEKTYNRHRSYNPLKHAIFKNFPNGVKILLDYDYSNVRIEKELKECLFRSVLLYSKKATHTKKAGIRKNLKKRVNIRKRRKGSVGSTSGKKKSFRILRRENNEMILLLLKHLIKKRNSSESKKDIMTQKTLWLLFKQRDKNVQKYFIQLLREKLKQNVVEKNILIDRNEPMFKKLLHLSIINQLDISIIEDVYQLDQEYGTPIVNEKNLKNLPIKSKMSFSLLGRESLSILKMLKMLENKEITFSGDFCLTQRVKQVNREQFKKKFDPYSFITKKGDVKKKMKGVRKALGYSTSTQNFEIRKKTRLRSVVSNLKKKKSITILTIPIFTKNCLTKYHQELDNDIISLCYNCHNIESLCSIVSIVTGNELASLSKKGMKKKLFIICVCDSSKKYLSFSNALIKIGYVLAQKFDLGFCLFKPKRVYEFMSKKDCNCSIQ